MGKVDFNLCFFLGFPFQIINYKQLYLSGKRNRFSHECITFF